MAPETKNAFLFARNFFKNPLRNASIVPSSREAAVAMLSGIDFSRIDTIVELGPGVGVFTEEILKRSRLETKIVLIEIEPSYVRALKHKFGDRIAVENTSAHMLDSVLRKHDIGKIDLIVSGLPSFPEIVNKELLDTLKVHTDRGTIYRFFTYLPPLVKRTYKNMPVGKRAFVFNNIPPLWVYGIN